MNKWIRFTFVYDPILVNGIPNMKVYIDNVTYPVKNRENQVTYQPNSGGMVLGRAFTNQDSYYVDVLIDDLTMWNRKLTETDIAAINSEWEDIYCLRIIWIRVNTF